MPPSDITWRRVPCDEDYARDRAYSSRFDSAIGDALRLVRVPIRMIRTATRREDTREATDAVVSAGVAFRIRRPAYKRYDDVTIRSLRLGDDSSEKVETEIDKMLVKDHCDIYFYGTAANEDGVIARHVVLDIGEVRIALKRQPTLLGPEISNKDGKTAFRPLRVPRLPPECILAEHNWRDIPCPPEGINVERFRVLCRTDGVFIVFDDELPIGAKTVQGKTFTSAQEAVTFARSLAVS